MKPTDYVGKWGLYPWFAQDGLDMIAPADRIRFEQLQPYGKVFYCLAADEQYITLQYGDNTYRVSPRLFQPVPAPPFSFGETVQIKKTGTPAIIRDIHWHHKEATHIYYVEVDGKRKSKRYFAHDFALIEHNEAQ